MKEVCSGRADSWTWPGAGLCSDWLGRGALGHAPGVTGWFAQRESLGDWARHRQVPAALFLSVGGGVGGMAGADSDPRLGKYGSLSAGEEARIAMARLLGVSIGEAGNPGPCKIASVNVTSLRRVVPAILKLDWDVLCVCRSRTLMSGVMITKA